MLSSLANYLLGGTRDGPDDRTSGSYDVATGLSQVEVEVEGDEWILIDRTVEGPTALEESWYVTPPACFTRAGPVNVETSPLENLLIEHPSMSVYRASVASIGPDTPPPTPDSEEDDDRGPVAHTVDQESDFVVTGRPIRTVSQISVVSRRACSNGIGHGNRNDNGRSPARGNRRDASNFRPAIHDGRPPHRFERNNKLQTTQLRSAQKVMEKRSTQCLKRGRLEKANKLREVFSVKGKRPRRQDRLRVQNSGANNNRKC